MPRSRSVVLALGGLAATALFSGCGEQAEDHGAATTRVAPIVRATTCAELLSSGWRAPDEAEPNVSWDAVTGDATIELTETQGVSLNIYAPECPKVDFIGPIVARMISDDALAKAQECADAVALILQGEVPRKGDIVGDADALRRHVTSYCPPPFERQLQEAGK